MHFRFWPLIRQNADGAYFWFQRFIALQSGICTGIRTNLEVDICIWQMLILTSIVDNKIIHFQPVSMTMSLSNDNLLTGTGIVVEASCTLSTKHTIYLQQCLWYSLHMGKPCYYVTRHECQLSLLPSVDWEVSTGPAKVRWCSAAPWLEVKAVIADSICGSTYEWQVKLCDPLLTDTIPEHIRDESYSA